MATHNWLGYFGVSFDSDALTEPRSRYAIFSSQRTGSNYLCARLCNVKDRLGMPMEYLHPDAIRSMGGRLFPGVVGVVSLDSYLHAVAQVRTTRDGWFGTKIQPGQLLPHLGADFNRVAGFLGRFDRLIFMTRRDKLRQAISGAIAEATGVWFNFGSEPSLEGLDVTRLFPQIERLQAQYVKEERLIDDLRGRLAGRPSLHISYEEILEDPHEAFRRVAACLGIDDTALVEEKITTPPTRKPPGALADRIREAYLRATDGGRAFTVRGLPSGSNS